MLFTETPEPITDELFDWCFEQMDDQSTFKSVHHSQYSNIMKDTSGGNRVSFKVFQVHLTPQLLPHRSLCRTCLSWMLANLERAMTAQPLLAAATNDRRPDNSSGGTR